MPKDQWKKANDRARFGPNGAPFGRTKPIFKREKVFTVPPGVKCEVREPGGTAWKKHTTTTTTVYTRYTPQRNGALWQMSLPNGWAIRVHPKDILTS